MNRINAGYVLTRNPMNHAQISKIPLSPDIVDCIVFWTKDPRNIMNKLVSLDRMGFKYYFQFTLTPYDKTIERGLRDKSNILDTFISLSKSIGKSRVLWRYDPIIINDTLGIKYHKEQFTRMCEKLCSYTESVTISFVDMYPKIKCNVIRPIGDDTIAELSTFIGEQAQSYGLTAKACCEKHDLTRYGITKASCIDKDIIEHICGTKLSIKPDKNQRDGCGCYESIDIGAYNTCRNGCVYCYANYSDVSVINNCRRHNPLGELLIGEVSEGEEVSDRKVKSNREIRL
jgi:hypothetical protein